MISIKGLKKQYDGFTLDVSMEIPDGTVTGIVGKNGAGKSTTIKSILGLIKPDAGSVCVMGKAVDQLTSKDKEKIGVALADSGFSFQLNVEDIIAINKKLYPTFDEGKFRRQCKEQDLPLQKNIKDYSTGMKAKLRVLTAISHDAKLLVLDEPTSGLDVVARNEILDMLRSYLEEDSERSILISSHISSDLEGLCDDIYFIHQGKVLLHEDTDRILGQYGVLKVSEEDYKRIEKQYLICTRQEGFGYTCLTNEKKYYMENYPNIIIENGSIDEMIVMMLSGGK